MARARGFLATAAALAAVPAALFAPSGALLAQGRDADRALRTLQLATVDLDDPARQSTVHRIEGRYLGHPSLVLLADGTTLLCAFVEGHRSGAIHVRRSRDGGRTWEGPLRAPSSFANANEVPILHRFDAAGGSRVVLFTGRYPLRASVSANGGETWSELTPVGEWGGLCALASVVRRNDGTYAGFFHDDGSSHAARGFATATFSLWCAASRDGLAWSAPVEFWSSSQPQLAEPFVLRAPDGQLVMLLGEETHRLRSHRMTSSDDGITWSEPAELPPELNGDRHVAVQTPEGRLFVAFRDMANGSPTYGDWIGWVGTAADVAAGRRGAVRVRLSRNWRGTDCGYGGTALLGDGTIVAVAYGWFEPGHAPFVRCTRFTLAEVDALAAKNEPLPPRRPGAARPTERLAPRWHERHATDVAAAKKGGVRVVFLGDSITEGWLREGKDTWERLFAPRGALDAGISGDRTQNVLWRLDHGLIDALAKNGNDVRLAVVMIGTNNSNGDECSAGEIAEGIEAVVRRVRQGLPDAKVLLLSIFPRGEVHNDQRRKNARASRLAAAAFAHDDHVVARDLGWVFLGAGGTIDRATMPDYLHLSPAAYRALGDALVTEIEPLLR